MWPGRAFEEREIMKHSMPFTRAFIPALFCIGFAVAAQDHNSSRSNKTSSIAAPDTGSGTVDMKVKEKANRTKSMTTNGSQDPGAPAIAIGDEGSNNNPSPKGGKAGIAVNEDGTHNKALSTGGGAAGMAIDEGGTPKVHKGKKPAAVDKDKDGDPSISDCDDNDPKRSMKSGASDCGTAAVKTKNGLQDKKNR